MDPEELNKLNRRKKNLSVSSFREEAGHMELATNVERSGILQDNAPSSAGRNHRGRQMPVKLVVLQWAVDLVRFTSIYHWEDGRCRVFSTLGVKFRFFPADLLTAPS